jgi:homoserine dehydrogenase
LTDVGRTVRLGLLGYGTVGRSFVRLLERRAEKLRSDCGVDLRLVALGSRSIQERKGLPLETGVRLTTDLASVAEDPDVDILIELMGGLDPAQDLIRRALGAGKSVVTANKLLLARRGAELAELAFRNGVGIGLEASVAGGIPILRALRESFSGDSIESIAGILNGTCNYILTEMERTGRGYTEIVRDAQQLGYAEADPASDVEGTDAAYKLALLSRIAFGQCIDADTIFREGITRLLPCDFVYARQLGRSLRQLGTCRLVDGERLALSVRTHLVASDSMLAKVEGPFNAVLVTGETGGEFLFYGRGAGGDPTAVAVLSDVIELARSGPRTGVPPLGFSRFAPFQPAGPEDFIASYYLRFIVKDQPGIIADISRHLADEAINIDAVFQAPYSDKEALPFVVTLEPVSQKRLERALSIIQELPFHAHPPLALPMTP